MIAIVFCACTRALGAAGMGPGRLERFLVQVAAVAAVRGRHRSPVERLEPARLDRYERRGRVDPVQALCLAARVVVAVVVELVQLLRA